MDKQIKILLVEDDQMVSQMYYRKLTRDGFALTLAGNGEEGLAALKNERPDIILLDVMMPKLNGFETLKIIKKDPVYKNLPVVILTNLGDRDDDIAQCKKMGAVDYWVKANTEINDLSNRIKTIIKDQASAA